MTSLRAYEVKGHMESLDEQLISASRTLHIDLCEHTFGCTSQLFLVRHECPRMAFLEVILFICPVQRMTSLSECATYITLHECPRDTFPWPKGSGPWLAWNVLKKPSSFREAIFFMCPFKRISSFAYRKIFSSSFSTSLVSVYLSSFRENIPSCALSQKKKTSSSSRQILVVFFLHFLVSAYSNLRPALMSREKKKVQAFPPCTHPETLCTRYVRFFGSDLWRRKSYHSHVNM